MPSHLCTISPGAGYGINEFREDLKKCFFTAGIEKTEDGKIGCPIVFLFADTQVVDESFIEDINKFVKRTPTCAPVGLFRALRLNRCRG